MEPYLYHGSEMINADVPYGDTYHSYYPPEDTTHDERKSSHAKRLSQRRRDRHRRSRSGSDVSRSRSRARMHSRSRSDSVKQSRVHSAASRHNLHQIRTPKLIDSLRVLFLTPSPSKKNTSKYLATVNHRDRIREYLKRDGLGSKSLWFYPRNNAIDEEPVEGQVAGSRDNCDQRIKVDGKYFRACVRGKPVDTTAPIAKLKRWELILYKKLGFIHPV